MDLANGTLKFYDGEVTYWEDGRRVFKLGDITTGNWYAIHAFSVLCDCRDVTDFYKLLSFEEGWDLDLKQKLINKLKLTLEYERDFAIYGVMNDTKTCSGSTRTY